MALRARVFLRNLGRIGKGLIKVFLLIPFAVLTCDPSRHPRGSAPAQQHDGIRLDDALYLQRWTGASTISGQAARVLWSREGMIRCLSCNGLIALVTLTIPGTGAAALAQTLLWCHAHIPTQLTGTLQTALSLLSLLEILFRVLFVINVPSDA